MDLLGRKCADPGVTDDDPQRPSASRLRHLVELPDHERPAAIRLLDLDLDGPPGQMA
jgi:hypothetical protein